MTPSRRDTTILRTRNFPPRRDPSHPVIPLPHFFAIKETIVTQIEMLFLIKNWFFLVTITSLCSSFLPISPPFPFCKPLRVLSLFPFLPPVLSYFNPLPSKIKSRNIYISGAIREHRFSLPFRYSSSSPSRV